MFYVKNLPTWERWARGIFGVGLATFGATSQGNGPIGWLLIAGGVISLLTGLVGFCPMCAMVGRKPQIKA